MAQSEQERIDALESKLASLSYRLEDMEKELALKIKVIEELLKMKIRASNKEDDEYEETVKVTTIGYPGTEKIVVNKRQKYEGEGCSCSPMGMPHSINCKGYWSGPSYEDLRDKITRYEQL